MFPGIKQPETICYRLNHFWYTSEDVRIDFCEAKRLISTEKAVVVKQAVGSSGGHAVTFLEKSDNYIKGFSKVISSISEDIIVQRPIIQHEQLEKLNDSSVNTLRVVSL